MKHFLLILALCLPSFGSIAFVQSALGGSATASVPAHTVLTTSAGGFGIATTPGNFLVCIVWATTVGPSASAAIPITAPDFGVGFAWSALATPHYFTTSPRSIGQVAIFYRENAPSVNTFGTASADSSTGAATLSVEFALLEFSGVALSGPLVDASANRDAMSGGTPGFTLTTTQSDLIIVAMSADANGGGNIGAGAGFALGPIAIVATIGQVQYQLNSAVGSVPSFFATTEPSWGANLVAFKPPAGPPPGSGVVRHKGYVF